MAKVGRNDPCPCGSGKKYKRCHGFANTHLQNSMPWFDEARARSEAEQVQRERQQGFGKPIISAQHDGVRLVVVKNRLLQSKGWRTFEDFLCGYIKTALGVDWGKAELAKPMGDRHPVLVWYHKFCEYQRKFTILPGKVTSLPQTGATRAYLHLAYDLYALDHNADLQTKLLSRLRNPDQFTGARYEISVAAAMIRAGFDIEFEDETDFDTTHCEFTATYRRTGKRFSVEVKRCENRRTRIGRLFNGALAKRANHARIIFIDINLRDDVPGDIEPTYKRKAVERLRSLETELLNGEPKPPAYVFVTNYPWALYLDEPEPRCTFLAEGFRISTFKSGVTADLRSVIDAREEHIEMHELIKSMKDHAGIPSTFDGEIPEFAFHSDAPRLLVGRRYMVGLAARG